MESPPVPSILPPGISHPAKRSCMQTSPDENSGVGQGRRGNVPPQGLKIPHPPSGPPPPDSGRRGYTPGRQDHTLTPRGGWQSPCTPQGTWQGMPHVRSTGRVQGFGQRGDVKHGAPFVPREGDMKLQLSSTTMAWVDRQGNILHQWKRTKRGTRGGKNRRQEELQAGNTPSGSQSTPRDKSPCGGVPSVAPESQEPVSKESSSKQVAQTPPPVAGHQSGPRHDSDCSSTCDLHEEPQAEASQAESVHTPPDAGSHKRSDSLANSEVIGDPEDFNADQMVINDPSSTSPHEMAELITRLYGLVNVLQSDNEQLRKTCAEVQLNSSSSNGEVAQLKQKLQQVTSERDLLQQQVLFQH